MIRRTFTLLLLCAAAMSGAHAAGQSTPAAAPSESDQLVITDAAGGEDFFYPTFNFTGSIALDGVGVSGTFQGVAAGAFAGAITLDDVGVAGSFGASSGTLTSEPLRTNNGTLLASTGSSFDSDTHLRSRSASPMREYLPVESSSTMISLRPAICACITRQRPASAM